MTNKQSSATASVLFSDGATLFSNPTSENISGVFCWIYLDWSHGMTRQHLSMFFVVIIGLSLTIEALTWEAAVVQTYTLQILHVAHWCFLFLLRRVCISCLLKTWHCVFYITSRVPHVNVPKCCSDKFFYHPHDKTPHCYGNTFDCLCGSICITFFLYTTSSRVHGNTTMYSWIERPI